MLNAVVVFIGGGLGSVLRYLISSVYVKHLAINIPLATFSVNVVGSLILGCAFGYMYKNPDISSVVKYAVTVGFCGGFTTFSTFSLESFMLLEDGKILVAVLYMIVSVMVCLSACAGGFFMAKYYV